MRLEIEKQAIKKDTDEISKKRLLEIKDKIAVLKKDEEELRKKWEEEKAINDKVAKKKEEIEQAKFKLEQAENNYDLENAAKLRHGIIPKLETELAELKSKDESQILSDTVEEDDIAGIISKWTKIPIKKLVSGEKEKLLLLEENMKKRVKGQDEAIKLVSDAILRSRAGINDPNRPIGSFIFLGPTGVGKTEVAKTLAYELFDDERHMVRIDMSEYMEKFTVSRLVGAPPGYVGYEEGGQLTEKVRRKPYSIVLLDEIEKAHPDVFNILLQVMDEGRLTDSYGRTVDFKNTIVIMTSNIGTRQLKEFGKGIGFAAQVRTDDKEYSRSVITKALNKSFAPEFINRLDEIITFDQLDMDALTRIIDIELKGLYSRVENIGYKLVIDEDAKKFVATKGYDVQFGARPLKRAIQNNLEDGISELILGSEMAAGDTIKVSYDKEKDLIVMTVEK
mgnify:CR=1 FL=1